MRSARISSWPVCSGYASVPDVYARNVLKGLRSVHALVPGVYAQCTHQFLTQWSVMRVVGDSPYHWCAESVTPRIGDSGESFFEYEYLREFEAKIRTARKVVYGAQEEPISAKASENPPHYHVPLSLYWAMSICVRSLKVPKCEILISWILITLAPDIIFHPRW